MLFKKREEKEENGGAPVAVEGYPGINPELFQLLLQKMEELSQLPPDKLPQTT